MTEKSEQSIEELESVFRASLGNEKSRFADKLIKLAKSLDVSSAVHSRVDPKPLQLPDADACIRAAISHTFIIVPPRKDPVDLTRDEVTPENESVQSALLANSTTHMIKGRRRLLLTDKARADLLDRVQYDERYRKMLQAVAAADQISFDRISTDDERLPSAWLRSFLTGNHGKLERAPAREARAAVEALERLQLTTFTTPPRPNLETARRLRGLAELLEPLRILIGQRGGWENRPVEDRFVGRKEELTKLRGFVDELQSKTFGESVQRLLTRGYRQAQYLFGVRDESVFFLEARGGLGKSTLMAKFTLDHALGQSRPFPFAYLDFDRAALRPRNPRALLLEVARQVGLQLTYPVPALDSLCTRLRDDIAGTAKPLTSISDPFDDFREIVQEFLTHGSRPFLVVLDTMEVVQYDPKSLAGIIDFLTNLSGMPRGEEFSELKIVAAGRADIPDLRTNPEERPEHRRILLDALEIDEARAMANQVGKWLMPLEWQPEWAQDVAGRKSDPAERREPLTIRVAVELLRDTPKEERDALSREIAKAGEEANQYFVGRLYQRRILSHIRNPDVRNLAWPGLIFRRMTPDLIRDPLAALCGVDPARADELFYALANEVWMVEDQGPNTIRHRPDLRARTLPLMRRHDARKFAEVNRAAIEYFAKRRADDPGAHAEWVYHRLLEGEDCEIVDRDWTDTLPTALAGAEDDFDRNSATRIYLQSRTSSRLLPPAVMKKLSPRLVLDHIARAGEQLGAFDDTRTEPVLVDIASRFASSSVSTTFEHPVKAVLLVKTGRWNIDADFGGARGAWAGHADFAHRYWRARRFTKSGSAPKAPSFDEDSSPLPLRTLIQDLAWSRVAFPEGARKYNVLLAKLLQGAAPTPNPSDIAALRTAAVFGWETSRPAARLWLESQSLGGWTMGAPSLSLAELRAILGAGKAVRKILRKELEIVLEKLGISWEQFLAVARDPVAQPMRIAHPDIATVRSTVVKALLEDESPDSTRHLREFFGAHDEDWIIPISYAAARTKPTQARAQLLSQRMESHVEFFDRQGIFSSRRKRPWTPKELMGMLRAADGAADLLGVARIFEENDASGAAGHDLRDLLVHYATWRERIQRILNEQDAPDPNNLPPSPLPVRHKDDIQKDRWGGTEGRDGRVLEAHLGEVTAHDFDVDLIVRSTDGSVLEGPVIFHLHDTFSRSRIAIRTIREGSWAALQEVNSYGVFTAAAQVRNRLGSWTSLELDLKGLKGLPRRFLSR